VEDRNQSVRSLVRRLLYRAQWPGPKRSLG
jgi:hypothetical protein